MACGRGTLPEAVHSTPWHRDRTRRFVQFSSDYGAWFTFVLFFYRSVHNETAVRMYEELIVALYCRDFSPVWYLAYGNKNVTGTKISY